MEANDIPPVLGDAGSAPEPEPASPPKARWRWWVHVIVLAMFPLLFGVLSLMAGEQTGSLLPSTAGGLVYVVVQGVLIFGAFFLIAWLASRANATDLMLKWRSGGMPLVWGIVYSVGLRIIIIAPALAWTILQGLQSLKPEQMEERLQHLADPKVLTSDPAYLMVSLTLVSFVLGGLREELWRAAMFAGFKHLFPKSFATTGGKAIAIVIIAVLFGCGHVSQGALGVILTGFIGIALGVVMLWHRSLWEATIAHGIFDATTFALIWWVTKFHSDMFHQG
jgi:membrane protease YdiL (CAAX protease family)